MKYIKSTTEFYIEEPTVISLGKFDGIHRGHELLLEQLLKKKQEGYKTVIFTFDIPPKKVIGSEDVKVLTTNEEKMHMFESFGIDYLIECPFTPEIMTMEPECFIEMLVKKLSVKCIVAGEDFCFGHNRRGNYQMLKEYADKLSYEAIILPKMKEERRDISSTFVREEISAGRIERANKLLGYPYFVSGQVKHGKQIGRTIGFPTVNVLPAKNKLLPPNGVYYSRVAYKGNIYAAISNVGYKPTVSTEKVMGVESYLYDFDEEIYEEDVEIYLCSFKRGEKQFAGVEELKKQLAEDIRDGALRNDSCR